MKSGYIGSVRFFKNLILLAVIVAIAVPSATALRYRMALRDARGQIVNLSEQIDGLEAQEAQSALSLLVDVPKEPETPLGSTLEAEVLEYQTLYPDFYAPQPYQATQRTEKTMYLTFDDGPSERTDEILEILAEKDAKATFYVVGQTSQENLERMKKIAEQGHTLAMHSYSHDYNKIYASVEAYLEDMYQIFCQIRDTTGQTPTLFRMPGGSINGYNSAIYQELLAEMLRRGFVPCDWNLSSGDAANTKATVPQILANVVGNAGRKERGFVLMHDSVHKTTTVEALGAMIDQLREMGFQLEAMTPQTLPVLYSYRE